MGLIHEKNQGPKISCYCTFNIHFLPDLTARLLPDLTIRLLPVLTAGFLPDLTARLLPDLTYYLPRPRLLSAFFQVLSPTFSRTTITTYLLPDLTIHLLPEPLTTRFFLDLAYYQPLLIK
jgi:hypothetical protein